MAGRVDNIILTVNKYEDASHFYDWLLPRIGYTGGSHDFGTMKGWVSNSGSLWVKKADARFASDTFHKDRVGLCEVAFKGDSRAQVDELAQELEKHGGRILDPPREYDYVPGSYAVFFTDPHGIKLEVVHIPYPHSHVLITGEQVASNALCCPRQSFSPFGRVSVPSLVAVNWPKPPKTPSLNPKVK